MKIFTNDMVAGPHLRGIPDPPSMLLVKSPGARCVSECARSDLIDNPMSLGGPHGGNCAICVLVLGCQIFWSNILGPQRTHRNDHGLWNRTDTTTDLIFFIH